jgi:Ca2+-binding RTX toxin-like protein
MAAINGTKLSELLDGTEDTDQISGFDGNDTLFGEDSDDTLDGGKGADFMDGGNGGDVYVVDNIGDVVHDTGSSVSGSDVVQTSISYSLATAPAIEGLILTGKAAINGTGNNVNNIIDGNGAANRLSGGSGDDFLHGFGGNDTLDGGTGEDAMFGGDGNDVFIVNNALDQVSDTKGTDTVISSVSFKLSTDVENLIFVNDIDSSPSNLQRGEGNDLSNRIVGSGLANLLIGGLGSDTLDGGEGSDILRGEDGADLLIGGGGNDTYEVSDKGDRIQESIPGIAGGRDFVIYSGTTAFVLGANLEDLRIENTSLGTGNALDNTINSVFAGGAKLLGLAGDDVLIDAGGGNSTLDGGSGVDRMFGGDGNDLFMVDNGADFVSGGAGFDEIRTNLSVLQEVIDVESYVFTGGAVSFAANSAATVSLAGTKFADTLKCDLGNNFLFGLGGNDTLFGGAGSDQLDGGAGADSMIGGIGDDSYLVDNAKDVVDELSSGNSGIDAVVATVSFSLSAATVFGDIENLFLNSAGPINGTGNSLDNTIAGNFAANRLDGAAGADNLVGFGGNDTLVVDALDVASGGTGIDTVIATASINFAGVDDVEIYTLSKGSGAISVTTGDNANKITGNESGNIITANDGNDTVDGGLGNDAIDGGLGDDIITGGAGDDLLIGGFGENKINVAMGNDTVESGALVLPAHDVITGFDGNAAGGQDVVRLASLFDGLGIDPGDRAAHVQIVDKGSTVEIHVDTSVAGDGNFDLFVATLQTKDAITVGEDVLT